MTDYDAIVIGAGHNGLTSAVLLQQAGLRTLCLESKLYSGGMASNVELFDGYTFEIAGSVVINIPNEVDAALGLDTLPTVDVDVMSVSLCGNGDEPLVYYTDPMRLFEHLNERHGAEVVAGMAELAAWSAAPARAMGRFEADMLPRTLDQMYGCATNEAERAAIDDVVFGSVSDVLDRYLPDKDKHAALRGMLCVLALNSTYRGPQTPGSAAALAYGLALPEEGATLVRKLRGGIGTLTGHLRSTFEDAGGELRLRSSVAGILAAQGRVSGVRLEDGEVVTAPVVVSSLAPDLTVRDLVDPAAMPAEARERFARVDHRGSYVQMHFAMDGMPEFAAPYEMLDDPAMHSSIVLCSTPEELQQQWEDCRRGIVPAEPTVALQVPTVHDPELAPPGKHAVSAFALWFPVEGDPEQYGQVKREMGQRVIDRITRLAPTFERRIIRHTTFTPRHMGTMFGAPGGDYCHGLLHADQMGPHRPGPRGYIDSPLPLDGLYLGSAGCHGGPGITFVPGYNAARAALRDQA